MYQLKEKASMWWDQLVKVQHIREKDITWKEFKRYFEKKYLTKRYYDINMKDLFQLKQGSMTIDEYEQIFLELLKYVSFIKYETIKIQRYLSGLPPSIGDKIQYVLHIIFVIHVTINDVNLYVAFRGVSGLSS
jgi:hypothetical protein